MMRVRIKGPENWILSDDVERVVGKLEYEAHSR